VKFTSAAWALPTPKTNAIAINELAILGKVRIFIPLKINPS
jgi:hypothetical protein